MENALINKGVNGILLGEEWPEYRLVIPADEPVSKQVRHLRMQWEILYGKDSVSEKPPSVTLACFSAREEMEETLIRWIQRICDQQNSFSVTLNNISAMPPHMIYIRVQDEKPFSKLAHKLKALEDFMKDRRIFEKPFIKLGQLPSDIPTGNFMLYTHQLFHAAFMARKLILFRKEKDNWRVVSNFPFRKKDEQEESVN
jgi:hypothetical protein